MDEERTTLPSEPILYVSRCPFGSNITQFPENWPHPDEPEEPEEPEEPDDPDDPEDPDPCLAPRAM